MNTNPSPGPTVDQIMDDIRQNLVSPPPRPTTRATQPTPLQTKGLANPTETNSADETGCDTPSSLSVRDRYLLQEFLQFEDASFLRNAYRAIIRRAPDHEGSAPYLRALRTGAMTKVDILGRLRFSREGRRQKVTIRGLILPFVWNTACHAPALGYLLRLLEGLVTLPLLLRRQRVLAARQRRLQARLEGATEQLKIALIAQFQDSGQDWSAVHGAFPGSMNGIPCQHDHPDLLAQHHPSLASSLDRPAGRFPADFHADFENSFRGTREEIRHRFHVYLPWVAQVAADKPFLDLGCGRGEFLELLHEHGKPALGVDANPLFVAQCHTRGLHVVQQDVLAMVQAQPAASVGAVTAMHLIEHLPGQTIVALFQELFRVLVPGGLVIIESPNPENLQVGACLFHLDPTHIRPFPPATTEHLLRFCGFSLCETLRLHPFEHNSIPDELREPGLSPLKQLLYGPQDYAVIARKAE